MGRGFPFGLGCLDGLVEISDVLLDGVGGECDFPGFCVSLKWRIFLSAGLPDFWDPINYGTAF